MTREVREIEKRGIEDPLKDLWDAEIEKAANGDEIKLLLYRSNLLGAELAITNYGGGNTSCKFMATDPIVGEPVEVMWVKGSGGDLGTLKRSGLSGLYVEKVRALKTSYNSIEQEDEIFHKLSYCLYEPQSASPSIDTPLHALLPFRHIDHLHPDAIIAIAASRDGRSLVEEIWQGEIGWIDWQRPGFDLALQLELYLSDHPGIKGIILGGHGLFTWGETSRECYQNSLQVIREAMAHVEKAEQEKGPAFGGQRIQPLDQISRRRQAARIAPILRGYCSSEQKMIGHFSDDAKVLEFVNSRNLNRLAPMGTSCPDHFLRTKIRPMILPLAPDYVPEDLGFEDNAIKEAFEKYRKAYAVYYESQFDQDSPPMRDPNPVVILYPGVGMFTFARNKATARVAAEFYINAINVIRGAEALSAYQSLPEAEAFRIEYWQLEEAKLKRMPPPKPLTGKIALVTGSAGGIGLATARKFAEEGACIVLSDIHAERLETAFESLIREYGDDTVTAIQMDVAHQDSVDRGLAEICLAYGGIDILINNAGLSISKPLEDHTTNDWNQLFDTMVKGQFVVSQAVVNTLRAQRLGGDIVNVVSKNSVVAGVNNIGYGSAKAAQAHMTRLLAAELGKDGIRVNMVNPDGVIIGSNIWESGWAQGRADLYGIAVAELPEFYAKRTLLGQIILTEDIANAIFAFVGNLLQKSTGNALNVDGGLPMSFLR